MEALSNTTSSMSSETATLLADATIEKLAEMFNIPASDIDGNLPMSLYGVDSLIAVELRKWFSSFVCAEASGLNFLRGISLQEFAKSSANKFAYIKSR
ncbi:hypothetical protein BX600DRAFT_303120 [Xylariales sp. PMI_506]|nr:hypothetical protein BX600DRAFT_303120 [Xylariales sp. PMI_506]